MPPAAHAASHSASASATATATATAAPSSNPDRKRVKVYELKDNDWFDRGTGFCTGQMLTPPPSAPDTPDARIVVVSEDDANRTLLETRIFKDESYQKQQDTLIVWTEQNGVDMALSFQEAEACASIWEFVHEIQQKLTHLSGPEDGLSDDLLDPMHSITLPDPQLGQLDELEAAIRSASTSPASRDSLAKFVMHPDQNFILRLAPLVTRAEELESTPDLHRLCTIMKHLILLNDTAIIEFIVTDQAIMGVVGALEYDPDFPSHRANHRQWLADASKFKEVVPIQDAEVRKKIHWTYRLLYLKDVVLARILDDPTFSVLNSLIFYHQVDIVNHLQSNQQFLKDLFDIFAPSIEDRAEKKKEGVLFIQNCCAVSKTIQAQTRAQLYQNFIQHGLFAVITFALNHSDAAVRVAGTDILVALIDHDPHMVRAHIHAAQEKRAAPLMEMLIELLLIESDLGVKSQMAEAIKSLLDPNMNQFGIDMMNRGVVGVNAELMARQKGAGPGQHPGASQITTFIDNFYETSAKRLFAPLKALQDRASMTNLNVQETSLYTHLVELLCVFVHKHSFKSKLFILSENLHSRVAQLLSCPQKYMKLTALKWFRTCIALQDEFHNRQMIQNALFEPILVMLEETGGRDSLVNSACLEFFDYIKRESVKQLIVHLVDNYRERMMRIAYVDIFQELVLKYEQLVNGFPILKGQDDSFDTQEGSTPQRMLINGRQAFAGLKDMDGDEEAYFDTEDDVDEDDDGDAALPMLSGGGRQGILVNGASPLRPLVSYDADDEDENEVADVEGMDILASSPEPHFREKKSSSSSDDPASADPMDEDVATTVASGGADDDEPRGRSRTAAALEAQTSPPDSIPMKRRRAEEDEDELGKMMGGIKRRTSSASTRSQHSLPDTPLSGGGSGMNLRSSSGNNNNNHSRDEHARENGGHAQQQQQASPTHGHGNSHMLRRKGSLKVKNESAGKFAIKPISLAAAAATKGHAHNAAGKHRGEDETGDAEEVREGEDEDPGGGVGG